MNIAEFAIRRPVTVAMITLCLLVLGTVSLQRLPLEQLPNMSSSGVRVSATYRSSSPEEVERLITLPLEDVLATLGNVESISSSSSQSRASVRVDFKAGTDMDLANMEVRERVDQVRGLLPPDLERIQIWRWQSDQREIIDISMGWRGQDDRLLDIVRKVVEPRLLRLEGVANVVVEGIDEKQLIAHLDRERLEAHQVSLPALAWQVRDNNVNTSLGRVMDGEQRYMVRALGEFAAVEEIGHMPLIDRDIHLEDVADVVYDYPEKKRYERLNGVDAVSLEVFKAPTANVVEVADRVRQTLQEIEAEYGGKLEIEIVHDRAKSVLREVDNLKTAAFMGALLAVGIIFLFLRNIRSTLVIAISIPTAAVCVFTGMYLGREFFGSTITLNMVSMMGLMLAVGMLVDPAVVVLESIFRKREEEKDESYKAALSGSKEVGMAVAASSLTTMCVFIPFFFLSDSRTARWMGDAGVSICLAVAVSMVISLSVIPLASSILLKDEYRRFDFWLKRLVVLALLTLAGWLLYQIGWATALAWTSRWFDRIGTSLASIDWVLADGTAAILVALAILIGDYRRFAPLYGFGSLALLIGLVSWEGYSAGWHVIAEEASKGLEGGSGWGWIGAEWKILTALLIAAVLLWRFRRWWPLAAAAALVSAGVYFGLLSASAQVTMLSLLLLYGMLRSFHRYGMRRSYANLLDLTLAHRPDILLITGALVVLGVHLFGQIEQRGTPWTPERRVDVNVEVDRSYSLEEVHAMFEEMEQVLLGARNELDVESLSSNFRQRGGRLTVRLVDADDGNLSTMEATNAIKERLPEWVGVKYKMGRRRSWAGRTMGVEVQLRGRDAEVLQVLAEEVGGQLGRLPGVQDVDSSLEDGEEEIRVQVNREQALGYGLSPQDVGSTIATALGTRSNTTFKSREREIDVVLQLEAADRVDLEQLKNNRFEGRDGTSIQLASLADFHLREGPRDLQREDRLLTVTVFANTRSQGQAYALTGKVKEMMGTVALPPGYSWDLGRQARWMQQDTHDNYFTLIFALLLIYLIMASLFESLIHPFTIMLAIPFSLIGVALGLYALDVPMDNNAMLGLLILFGIVVNNGIVLIDHINHYRRQGMDRHQAILRGGQNRMRPILMTAFTTILNLMPLVLPMIYGTAEGFAKRWGPVGLVVVCGLTTSTFLTLIMAPTLYSLLDDVALWGRRVVRAARR